MSEILGLPIPDAGPVFAAALVVHVACGLTAIVGGALARHGSETRGGGISGGTRLPVGNGWGLRLGHRDGGHPLAPRRSPLRDRRHGLRTGPSGLPGSAPLTAG